MTTLLIAIVDGTIVKDGDTEWCLFYCTPAYGNICTW